MGTLSDWHHMWLIVTVQNHLLLLCDKVISRASKRSTYILSLSLSLSLDNLLVSLSVCVCILTKMTPHLVRLFMFVCAFVWGVFWVATVTKVLRYNLQVSATRTKTRDGISSLPCGLASPASSRVWCTWRLTLNSVGFMYSKWCGSFS